MKHTITLEPGTEHTIKRRVAHVVDLGRPVNVKFSFDGSDKRINGNVVIRFERARGFQAITFFNESAEQQKFSVEIS